MTRAAGDTAGVPLALVLVLLLALAAPAAAAGASPPPTWPPKDGPGHLFVHFGEEHWNDEDGLALLGQVVADSARYRPALVTMSGDKANNGVPSELERWREIMSVYDRAGIPYFAGVGNHDRDQRTGENELTANAGGVTPLGDIGPYTRVFAGRPYPMGDAPPYDDPLIAPRERPAGDPAGAASHYWVDYGDVRWIFVDNSCYGIVNCEPLQAPADGEGLTQYEFLSKHAAEAKAAGKKVFVVMHMPTRDPGDQSYRKLTARSHTMGKGASPDNEQFERAAEAAGVDAVFVAHIKGQFIYRGQGGIPYYIDGGAGGDLYTDGPVGTDHGYWHGYRLVRVAGGRVTTDAVPILSQGSLRIEGPDALAVAETARFAGFGSQPIANAKAKVDALELRDPDPIPKPSDGLALPLLQWVGGPALALLLLAGRRARRRLPAVAVPALGLLALGAVALAADATPTSTPKDSLPNPARMWTSANPRVLAPVASPTDDPRRDLATQTADGEFRAACPGRTTLSLSAGWQTAAHAVEVPSGPGAIATALQAGARRGRRGRPVRAGAVRLAQSAVVRVRVRDRRGRLVATPLHECLLAGRHVATWLPPRRGRFRVEVAVLSDRAPLIARRTLEVR